MANRGEMNESFVQPMRLQRYLSLAGIASRRHAEQLIREGRLRIDGRVVREMGALVQPGAEVVYDGRPVHLAQQRTTLVAHKPVGMITTLQDPEGRPSVAQLVPRGMRLYPIGRLDYATSGVLLLTDDGALAQILTHPRHGVEKTYRVLVRGRIARDAAALRHLRSGVQLEDGPAQPVTLRIVGYENHATILTMTVTEGRNRLVRRLCGAVGHEVLQLERLRFGPVQLGTLRPGATRPLSVEERRACERIVALAREGGR